MHASWVFALHCWCWRRFKGGNLGPKRGESNPMVGGRNKATSLILLMEEILHQLIGNGRNPANQFRLVVLLIIYRVLAPSPLLAGFLPPTVYVFGKIARHVQHNWGLCLFYVTWLVVLKKLVLFCTLISGRDDPYCTRILQLD